MSWQPAQDPECTIRDEQAIDLVIDPRPRDLGDFEVRRALPSSKRRTIGPFIFWDQMGPATFPAGKGIDVRPHPHIGLATVTYLFEGRILHRDSLGTEQIIEPGAVNLMTAGRGIVHSERTAEADRAVDTTLAGLQSWIALPRNREEMLPAFSHHPAKDLPLLMDDQKTVRLIMGEAFGETSPVPSYSPTLYVDVILTDGADLAVPIDMEERGVYVSHGAVQLAGKDFSAGKLAVLKSGTSPRIVARGDARVQILGGAPLDGPRFIWWNFVSSSESRIEQAKADWQNGRFDKVPGDDTEFIPLPEG